MTDLVSSQSKCSIIVVDIGSGNRYRPGKYIMFMQWGGFKKKFHTIPNFTVSVTVALKLEL